MQRAGRFFVRTTTTSTRPAPSIIALVILAIAASLALIFVAVLLLRRRCGLRTRKQRPATSPYILDHESRFSSLPRQAVLDSTAVKQTSLAALVIDITTKPPSPVTFRPVSLATSRSSASHILTVTPSSYTYAPTLPSVGHGYGYADRMFAKNQKAEADAQLAQLLVDHPSLVQDKRYSRQSLMSDSAYSQWSSRSISITPDILAARMRAGQPPIPSIPTSLRPGFARGSRRLSTLSPVQEPATEELSRVILSPPPVILPMFEMTTPPLAPMNTSGPPVVPFRAQRPRLRIDTGGPAPMPSEVVNMTLPTLAVPSKAARKHTRRR